MGLRTAWPVGSARRGSQSRRRDDRMWLHPWLLENLCSHGDRLRAPVLSRGGSRSRAATGRSQDWPPGLLEGAGRFFLPPASPHCSATECDTETGGQRSCARRTPGWQSLVPESVRPQAEEEAARRCEVRRTLGRFLLFRGGWGQAGTAALPAEGQSWATKPLFTRSRSRGPHPPRVRWARGGLRGARALVTPGGGHPPLPPPPDGGRKVWVGGLGLRLGQPCAGTEIPAPPPVPGARSSGL